VKQLAASTAELAGVGCLCYGVWLIWAPLLWLLVGLALVSVGYALDPDRHRKPEAVE
jgi:hypothetical protein